MTETKIKERPIIFSAESVRAILAGAKTQTRRVINPQPGTTYCTKCKKDYCDCTCEFESDDHANKCTKTAILGNIKPPYRVGERLWVREAWCDTGDAPGNINYKASATDADLVWIKENKWQWLSPLFMPRKHSRITLEIVDVRCEQLQDITRNDLIAEAHGFPGYDIPPENHWGLYPEAWDKLNAKRGFPWASSPWVWVIEFRRVEQ